MVSRVEIILGSMFSGKSTELIRRINRFRAIGLKTLIINHLCDTRTDNFIKTHDSKYFNFHSFS